MAKTNSAISFDYDIIVGDLLKASTDAIVVPQAIDGTCGISFRGMLSRLDLYPSKTSKLGDIDLRGVLIDNPFPFRYIIFVTSVGENGSTYAAIRKICKDVAYEIEKHEDIKSIAFPDIGAGAGKLSRNDCLTLIVKSFIESSKKKLLVFSLLEDFDRKASKFDQNAILGITSLRMAFDASVKISNRYTSIAVIQNKQGFYYDLAKQKYEDYINFPTNGDDNSFFEQLLAEFRENWKGNFIETLNIYQQSSVQYSFLKLCGELVAYIDYHAANKNEWNKNPDKRTIAKSNVKQNDWINNLIRFRSNGLRYNNIPSSIVNALKFLAEPSQNLTMLSDVHRAKLLKNVFGKEYISDESLEILFALFRNLGIVPASPINAGTLYSTIIYLGEIEELWLIDEENFEKMPIEPIIDNPDVEKKEVKTNQKSIEATFLTDYYAENDLLNYELYAIAIVSFINHKNTKPPLTIGIMAPWGKGKTSLMHFIEKKLKAFNKINANDLDIVEDGDPAIAQIGKEATFKLFREWIDKAKREFSYEKKLNYPTVWFNAWKFQKHEQIWAGFAHEIIHQLVDQLPNNLVKEEFWLRLNLKRIDQEKLKSKIRGKLLSKLISNFVAIGAALIFFIFSWTHFSNTLTFQLSGGIPFVAFSIWLYFSTKKVRNEKIDFDITKFIKQPDYSVKRGFFLEVEEDLRDVLKILVNQANPAVIFIDDLDRCAPNIVADVVEAINLFISGDFPECYFILGQDAQMVAASLDVAYDKIGERSSHMYIEQGSLGWHFMEKFVQLQFCIPVLSDNLSKTFFKSFFDIKKEPVDEERKREIEKETIELIKEIDRSEKIADLLNEKNIRFEEELKMIDPKGSVQLQEKIIQKAAEVYTDNDPEVLEIIEKLSIYVGTSPRAIKRFINLYRFYKFLQFTNRNENLFTISSLHLGQWIVFMIRWPQLVRAIQWNTEYKFINGSSAIERAKNFEELISHCENYEEWAELMEGSKNSPYWLKDTELFKFIDVCKHDQNALSNAVVMGVW